MNRFEDPFFNPFFYYPGFFPGVPPIYGFPLFLAGSAGGSSTALPAKPSAEPRCKPYNSEQKTLDLSCIEDKYIERTREEPRILEQNAAAHCGRDTGLFSSRVLVVRKNQDLFEPNPSKEPNASFFRIDCGVPTLWEKANPTQSLMETSLLTYASVKGKEVWIPNYLCVENGYSGFTIKTEKDFARLAKALEVPFDNEETSVMACYSSAPGPGPDSSPLGDKIKEKASKIISAGMLLALTQATENSLESAANGSWADAQTALKNGAGQFGALFSDSLQSTTHAITKKLLLNEGQTPSTADSPWQVEPEPKPEGSSPELDEGDPFYEEEDESEDEDLFQG